jgi:hypothetical protein
MKLKAVAAVARSRLIEFREQFPGTLGPSLAQAGEEFMCEPDICKLRLLAPMFLNSLFSGLEQIEEGDLAARVSMGLVLIGIGQLHNEVCPLGIACEPVLRMNDPSIAELAEKDRALVDSFFSVENLRLSKQNANPDLALLLACMVRPVSLHVLSMVGPIVVTELWNAYSVEIKLELAALLAMLGKVHSASCIHSTAVCQNEWEISSEP